MENSLSTLEKIANTVIEAVVRYGFQVLGALIILMVGFFIAERISRFLVSVAEKKKLDVTLTGFLAGCAKTLVLCFAIIIALGKFGISIAPFVAALSAMAFGASFAIQGPLSNYGAGLSIILTRPFVVGDTIAVAGVSGVVEKVTLAATLLAGANGVKITIPNKDIVGQIIHNSKEYSTVEGVVGVSYENSPEEAVRVIRETLLQFPEVARDPAPQVGLAAFGDSSLTIEYRCWVPTQSLRSTLHKANLAIHQALQQAAIAIPFPQREVRFLGQPSWPLSQGTESRP